VRRRAEFEAGEASGAGSRLDLFLTENLRGLTRSQIHKIILGGGVRVDGAVRKPGSRLKAGERIEVEFEEEGADILSAEDIPLRVLASDGSIVVLDKPSGMTVHPGAGRREGTLAAALIHAFPEIAGVGSPERPGIVHRLDRETSGVMVAARSPAAFESLSGQFRDRNVHKVYLGLVWGRMPAAEGCFTWAIGRHVRHGQKISVRTRRPKQAETRYRVLRRRRSSSSVRSRAGPIRSGSTSPPPATPSSATADTGKKEPGSSPGSSSTPTGCPSRTRGRGSGWNSNPPCRPSSRRSSGPFLDRARRSGAGGKSLRSGGISSKMFLFSRRHGDEGLPS
jgi:23S rRNA pseudouridine1911/1915/1917 synthase